MLSLYRLEEISLFYFDKRKIVIKASRDPGGFLYLEIGSVYLYNDKNERGDRHERMEAF